MAVVLPAYNEEDHVGGVISDIPAFVDRVIVVDDASTDRTAEVVLASERPNVELLQLEENLGMGAAIVTGFRRALADGTGLVAVMDADGQMDASYLPSLLDPLVEGRADFAKGNRFFSRGSFPGMPVHRVIGNVVLSLITKASSGYWHVFDSENGYTAISAETLRQLPLDDLEVGYQFANRFLIRLGISGARVADVPIPARYGEETSGIHPVRDGAAILWELIKGFWLRVGLRYFRPHPTLPAVVLIASVLGLLAGSIGLVAGLLAGGDPLISRAVIPGFAAGAAGMAAFFVLDARAGRRGRSGARVAEPQVVR